MAIYHKSDLNADTMLIRSEIQMGEDNPRGKGLRFRRGELAERITEEALAAIDEEIFEKCTFVFPVRVRDELRAARIAAHLTIAEVAEQAGLEIQDVQDAEECLDRWTSIHVISKICKVTGIDVLTVGLPIDWRRDSIPDVAPTP